MAGLAARIERARNEYVKEPTRASLRAYLVLKARTGRWDARYCRYYGVPSKGLSDWVRRFLTRGVAAGLVPTATTNGKHSAQSYHSDGRAGDLGLPVSLIGTAKGRKRLKRFQATEYHHRLAYAHTELIGPTNNQAIL